MEITRPYGIVPVLEWSAPEIQDDLKRAALLFERVYVATAVTSAYWLNDDGTAMSPVEAEIRWLFENGIVSFPDDEIYRLDDVRASMASISDHPVWTRVIAAAISKTSGEITVPLIGDDVLLRTPPLAVTREDVLHVVLYALPIPGPDTPWEAVLDWRSDQEALTLYARLRRWVNEMGRSGFTASEVRDELLGLLSDYDAYMALQHKKFARGRFEIVITAMAEVLESLATLKLTSAVEKLFFAGRENIALLEAEFGAPGREIAYVSEAHRRFSHG